MDAWISLWSHCFRCCFVVLERFLWPFNVCKGTCQQADCADIPCSKLKALCGLKITMHVCHWWHVCIYFSDPMKSILIWFHFTFPELWLFTWCGSSFFLHRVFCVVVYICLGLPGLSCPMGNVFLGKSTESKKELFRKQAVHLKEGFLNKLHPHLVARQYKLEDWHLHLIQSALHEWCMVSAEKFQRGATEAWNGGAIQMFLEYVCHIRRT